MAQKNKVIFGALFLFLFIQTSSNSFAQEAFPFQGRINSNNINIRSDSTISSEAICAINKGEPVEVVSGFYEWYKIKLPKNAPSFIKKDFVEPIDEKTAKISGNIVNVRLKPGNSSPILGKVKENEIVSILGKNGDWYRIEPVDNSFGWINKKFVRKEVKREAVIELNKEEQVVTVEGTIKPKVITGLASHKLITTDKAVFLLKGSSPSLNALNSRKAKIIGKIITPGTGGQGAPLIKVIKVEALD